MKRKLSSVEHMIDGNIVYFVRLEGNFQEQRLQFATARLQYKHPSLRMLIRQQPDGLYYEFDCAPPIPLRVLPRLNESDYRNERDGGVESPLSPRSAATARRLAAFRHGAGSSLCRIAPHL